MNYSELEIKRIKVILLLTLCVFFECTEVFSQSLAKGSTYVFSQKPNYTGTQGDDDTNLTDGVKKSGLQFWQDKSSVGWRDKKEIHIDLDLGENFSISGLLINTARGSGSEVEYPANCLVFTSIDKSNYHYAGDIMLSTDNTSGKYKVNSFQLKTQEVYGRYIKFVLIPKSKFIFLDEIEIFGSKQKNMNADVYKRNVIKYEDLNSNIEKILLESSEMLKKYIELKSSKDFIGQVETDKFFLETPKTMEDLNKIEANILNLKMKTQSQALPRGIIFTSINDLASFKTFNLNDVIKAQKIATDVIDSDSPYQIFSLINNSSVQEIIDFEFSFNVNQSLFEVLSSANLNQSSINDVLKPVDTTIAIMPGEHKFFLISKLNQAVNNHLIISTVGKSNKIVQIRLNTINNTSLANNESENLHANVWAYLDKPILKDNRNFVINDLNKSGVDVIVVHSAFIDGNDTKDFSKLKNYVTQFKNLKEKKILLFYNLKGNNVVKRFNGQKFLDQNWKNNFTRWYKLMQNELSKIGVNTEEVYFYPYDEIKADEVHNFVELVKWGRSTLPDFKTFVTIIDEKSFEAGNYADIVQLSQFLITKAKNIKNNQIWIYSVLDHSRERDPYKDYRLMAWYAYYYDIKGVGFWNYSALPTESDGIYTKVLNGNIDYSVLYVDKMGNILTSLRWLYFQQGLRDYSKLKAKEKEMGKEKLKKLVKEVIDNPNDSRKADLVLINL